MAVAAPERTGAGLCLGWEGAPGPRLGAANQARPGPGAAGAPRAHWQARPGASDSAARSAPGTPPRRISGLPATALGSPPGSDCWAAGRSPRAPLLHPPLNPPLPPNRPPEGGKRATWLLWEQGTRMFIGLRPPTPPQNWRGAGTWPPRFLVLGVLEIFYLFTPSADT